MLVRVEEELIKPAVEIVVMRHIAPRARAQIELLDAAKQLADHAQRHRPFRRRLALLPQEDSEDISDRALFDDERAVHIGFAQPKLGIEQDLAKRARGREPHDGGCAATIAECV